MKMHCTAMKMNILLNVTKLMNLTRTVLSKCSLPKENAYCMTTE